MIQILGESEKEVSSALFVAVKKNKNKSFTRQEEDDK